MAMISELNVGFLGFGEAAKCITAGLLASGLPRIVAYDKLLDDAAHRPHMERRAAEIGVTLLNAPVLVAEESRIIFSSVVSAAAVEAASSVAPGLTSRHIYIDANSSSPKVKREVGNIIASTGASVVDLAIMGPVPAYGHEVPALASGNGAKEASSLLNGFGMRIEYLNDNVGDASAAKMLRSIFMKGIAALLIEMLVAAEKSSITGTIIDSIEETLSDLSPKDLIKRLVGGTAIHAGRRAHEMADVIETLDDLQSLSAMSKSTEKILAWISDMRLNETFAGVPPQDPIKVIQAINNKAQSFEQFA